MIGMLLVLFKLVGSCFRVTGGIIAGEFLVFFIFSDLIGFNSEKVKEFLENNGLSMPIDFRLTEFQLLLPG